jgi:hypothetical protein
VSDLDDWFRAEPVPEFADGYWDAPADGSEPPLVPTAASCAPSGWTALDLDQSTSDVAVMSDAELVEGIVGFDRTASWAAARQARLLSELARRRPADAVPNEDRASAGSRFVPDEVAVALKLARGVAAGRVGTACRMLAVLPEVHALWESGRIDTAKARAIDEATAVLSDERAMKAAARVLPRAPEQSLAQLRAALARAILAVDPDGAAERHREARKDRRVHVQPEAEGMASLWALLTVSDAAGAYTWLTRLARGLGKDDPRTMDARRADLLAALLNGRLMPVVERVGHDPDDAPDGSTVPDDLDNPPEHADASAADMSGGGVPDDGGSVAGNAAGRDATHGAAGSAGAPGSGADPAISATMSGTLAGDRGVAMRPVTPGKPLIQIVMAYSTLVGANDQPAELTGYGPIPADLAREIAADGVLRRLITDPVLGTVLDYGRTTYHPPVGLADHVRVRDQHCRFPLCRRRAADAELDHVVAWADGGETSAANLQALCVHHHKLKTHAGWRVEAHPDGRLTWITPTGHRHATSPHDYGSESLGAAASVAAPLTDPPASADERDPDEAADPPPF